MNFFLDKPHDRLITERVQMLSGWVEAAGEEFELTAACGNQQIPIRKCFHPATSPVAKVQGFWGFLILQELLSFAEGDFLAITLFRNQRPLSTVRLRVSPTARELAIRYPLNLKIYPIHNGHRIPTNRDTPYTLVFPGLGGVGGTSLNYLMRLQMYRQDWPFPVYNEANNPQLWAKICSSNRPAVRWIDGHQCYRAANGLGRSFARITFLREPVRRFVSIFNYGSLVHPSEFPYASFEEFVSSADARQYTQAFGLLRCAGVKTSPSLSDDQLYALAKKELDSGYALVGITEMFEESVFLMSDLAGYSDMGMWWRVLSAPKSIDPDQLSDQIRRVIQRLLSVDLSLYREKREDLSRLLRQTDFGQNLQRYKQDASEQRDLPESYKMIECLRWRQILTEEQFLTVKQKQKKAIVSAAIERLFSGYRGREREKKSSKVGA